jgi:hypothetical protein
MQPTLTRAAAAALLLAGFVATGRAALPPLPPRRPGLPAPARSQIVTPAIAASRPTTGSPWQAFTNEPPFNPGAMLQLTDGTVIVQDQGPSNGSTGTWYKLTPDINGNYVSGTWSPIAAMPAGYGPLYFASAVLPSGRVIVEGGEYNLGQEVWTNQGALYDPVADKWQPVAPPTGSQWTRIGDAPSTVLANGAFMLGASGYTTTFAEARLNARTLAWAITGANKADANGEEGWTLLPNGLVLTVDTKNVPNAELFVPGSGAWTSAGATPPGLVNNREIGPQLLRPNGTVFVAGAAGGTAIYNPKAKSWQAGPSFPVISGAQYESADGAAAILPNGNVLVAASPGVYQTPAHFWEFDGATLTQIPDPPNAATWSSFFGFMMVLPTGQVLFNPRLGGALLVYNSTGIPQASWQPTIITVPTVLKHGPLYTITGRQLNGLTQGAAYGDDYQSATNFPLIRITNAATGHVFYARTTNMASMAVTPLLKSSADFTLPANVETGASTLVAVANGIASLPVAVTIR